MLNLDALYNEKQAASNGGLNLDALYAGNETNQGLNLDALYNGTTQSNSPINLDAIEEIESHHRNDLTSSTGAKGYFQFMPDTAEQYSKRLFGVGTRDASTLTEAQQKEMAAAYFSDLLKEFNGDVDKAVAAYNWGQGNVENKGLSAAPEETRNYLHKYHALSDTGYDHSTTKDMTETEWLKNQGAQIKDLWNGLTAEINKHTGNEYNQHDIDEVKAELNTDAGKALKTETAIAASLVAPEAIPELVEGAEASTMLKGANWLAKGLASSEAYQAIDNGKLSLKQTGIDLATGAALEGGLNFVFKPAVKQIRQAYNALLKADGTSPELAEAVKKYLGGARTVELGKHMQNLMEQGKPHTVLDGYQAMFEEVPEMFEGEQYETLKAAIKPLKNSSSPSSVINYGETMRDSWLNEARELAKDDAQLRKVKAVADANQFYNENNMSTVVDIADDILPDTLMQKLGKSIEEYAGFDLNKLGEALKKRKALKTIHPEVAAVKRNIRADIKRINLEMQRLEGKTGVSEVAKYGALNRQRTLDNQMLSYIDSGMKGRKVKIADIQQAIKDVQESQFNRGKYKNITKQFQTVMTKFDAMNVTKLEEDKSLVGQVAKHATFKAIAGTAGLFSGMGVPTAGIALSATALGKMSRAAKARNLKRAWELLHLEVKSGHMTFEEAEELLKQGFKSPVAEVGRRSASALRDAASKMQDNQK